MKSHSIKTQMGLRPSHLFATQMEKHESTEITVASPGEMVKRIAEVFGAPEATVTLHDRNLADAGLRTKGGRGRSAAKMTAADAANLLMAVAGSSMVKNAVQTVQDYSVLPSRGGEISIRKDAHSFSNNGNPPSSWDLADFPIPALQALPPDHTFRDALVGLIDAAADGSLREAVKNLRPFSEEHRIPSHWAIEVILWGPYPQAAIRIYCHDFSEKHHYSAIPTEMDAIMKWSKELEADRNSNGDLRQIREFSAKTILAVGDLLKN